ncbi:hypothetical protein TWF694_011519 [Orbilia ellipsospora]|uniref:Manganese lipoxygenase n=1 Tax=Orbilia ellipsospora TaxID=2528407 RepID=A0AAV9X833_9PEZI
MSLKFLAILAASAAAAPLVERTLLPPFSLPNGQALRASGVATKRVGFQYAPGIGGGVYSPGGTLGLALIANDEAITTLDLTAEAGVSGPDLTKATLDVAKYNNLQSLSDYVKLYSDEWVLSSSPTGQMPGMLTNYTQDLLFSMERLSLNPFAVRRLIPGSDSVPFNVDSTIVQDVTGSSLSSLLSAGRLFYVDHSDQAALAPTAQYGASCDALFYLSESSNQFLPLAIRTNVPNANKLIYTPKDSANDWLLAKIMFNVDDFFHGQFHHLAATHYVAEVAFQAAERTLSDNHPILAVFKRLMYGAFGIRPLAVVVLLRPGGDIDQFFAHTGSAAGDYSANLYSTGGAGDVMNNYLLTNLEKRGLINSSAGPALPHFPYYEDALAIYNSVHTFMTSFVNSYYSSDSAIVNDSELQAWMTEANGAAGAVNFPTSSTMNTRGALADLLTHMAHIVSTAHHTVNTNNLITGGGVLPFNPSAIYKPVPTAKGVTDVASYLIGIDQVLNMIENQAFFSRPLVANSNRTVSNMFNDPVMLGRMNSATRAANTQFMSEMNAQSAAVSSRQFDANGLCQGMPFIWRTLDPNVIPFTLTI